MRIALPTLILSWDSMGSRACGSARQGTAATVEKATVAARIRRAFHDGDSSKVPSGLDRWGA
jgi:hypothetical protein